MADEKKTDEGVQTEPVAKSADALVDTLEKMSDSVESYGKKIEDIEKTIEDLSKPQRPYGTPFAIRHGEDPLTSRPYSMMRLAKALAMRASNDHEWDKHAKVEIELSNDLRKAYYDNMGFMGQNGSTLIPFGSEFMPTHETELADGNKVGGLPRELVAKCRDLMAGSVAGFDPGEFEYLRKQGVIQKDMSWSTSTTGGTLVGLAAEGELIDSLRAVEVFSQAGAQQIDLPPQGSIRFPQVTGTTTIAAVTEGATISESTPATSSLTLTANSYSGLVDIPDELLRFATSVAIEVWLRSEFIRDLALKTDSDMLVGDGTSGTIKGILAYTGIETVIASTVGTDGDTLEAQDPVRLFAAIADNNAPVDRGFFFACTNTLWGGLVTRRADAITAADGKGPFVFSALTQLVGGQRPQKTLNGYPVICSTQVPTDRAKGAASNLTCLLGGVGSEWIIARSGVAEVVVTNSDASKFASRISTMRGTVYMDAGPRHEESFGFIDDLVNS